MLVRPWRGLLVGHDVEQKPDRSHVQGDEHEPPFMTGASGLCRNWSQATYPVERTAMTSQAYTTMSIGCRSMRALRLETGPQSADADCPEPDQVAVIRLQHPSVMMVFGRAIWVSALSSVAVRMAAALVGDFFKGLSRNAQSVAVHEIPAEVAHTT